jgi:hypothetical protein
MSSTSRRKLIREAKRRNQAGRCGRKECPHGPLVVEVAELWIDRRGVIFCLPCGMRYRLLNMDPRRQTRRMNELELLAYAATAP